MPNVSGSESLFFTYICKMLVFSGSGSNVFYLFQLDEYPTRENGDMFYGSHAHLSPGGDSLKDINPKDSTLSLFPDNDSGFRYVQKKEIMCVFDDI